MTSLRLYAPVIVLLAAAVLAAVGVVCPVGLGVVLGLAMAVHTRELLKGHVHRHHRDGA